MKIFRVHEAAELLGISRQTLLRYEKKGILPKQRRNRINSWREYTQNDIEDIKRKLKKGITLIEVMMVLVILGILAATAVPRLRGIEAIKLTGAAKSLVSDIRYAQQIAVSRHTPTRIIFNITADKYSAQEYIPLNASWMAIKSPFTKADLTVDYSKDPYAGTNINSASFGGTATLGFNWTGAPSGGGTVVLSLKGAVRNVLVENQTGMVSIQ